MSTQYVVVVLRQRPRDDGFGISVVGPFDDVIHADDAGHILKGRDPRAVVSVRPLTSTKDAYV